MSYQALKREEDNIQILMIEDNLVDATLFTRLLQNVAPKESLRIDNTAAMSEAFEILDNKHFDLVTLDLNLLDMGGIASIAALHSKIPDVPIIICSGAQDSELMDQAIMCGADYYLIKGKRNAFLLKFIIQKALLEKSRKKA